MESSTKSRSSSAAAVKPTPCFDSHPETQTEHDTAFEFASGSWTDLGSAAEHELSKARRAVLEAVTDLESATLTEAHRDCEDGRP